MEEWGGGYTIGGGVGRRIYVGEWGGGYTIGGGVGRRIYDRWRSGEEDIR